MENNETNIVSTNRENDNFVSIQNLQKIYPNGAKAVYDFNLDIKKGDFVVIVGPSGCGKTTTLRMFAGLEDVSKGKIFIDQEFVNYKPSKDRKIAIVFQSYALYPQMSVFDNIAFPLTINKYSFPLIERDLLGLREAKHLLETKTPESIIAKLINISSSKKEKLSTTDKIAVSFDISLEAAKIIEEAELPQAAKVDIPTIIEEAKSSLQAQINRKEEALKAEGILVNEKSERVDGKGNTVFVNRKMNKQEIAEKVFEAARVLDLGNYLDRLPKELSGGQMQRVALGRAIVKNVPIFLMDEPLSNLDAKLRLVMRSEIVKIHNRIKATTIYVTHDQTEAMTMATKIVVMSKGFIQQIGEPEVIYKEPANLFVAKFVGSPSINIFEGNYDGLSTIEVGDGITIKVGKAFKTAHDTHYSSKLKEFQEIQTKGIEHEVSREFMLKTLSALGQDDKVTANSVVKKESLLDHLFHKKEETSKAPDLLAIEFSNKIEELNASLSNPHPIIFGIRPEDMKIDIFEGGEKPKDSFFITPTAVELLGNEYIIHFDFLGKDMAAKIDAKRKITPHSCLTLTFNEKDLLFFDAVTGSRLPFKKN